MSRITEHPILGVKEEKKLVSFTFDGKDLQGYEGEPIAIALKANGVSQMSFKKSLGVWWK